MLANQLKNFFFLENYIVLIEQVITFLRLAFKQEDIYLSLIATNYHLFLTDSKSFTP